MTDTSAFDPTNSFRDENDAERTLICFSHLRWDFVLQRPQHLMTFLARYNRVIFWEEPVEAAVGEVPHLDMRDDPARGVRIATPRLPRGLSPTEETSALRGLLDAEIDRRVGKLLLWYYTPMMLPFSRHLEADCTVYDCMDELANFRFAPPELLHLEGELLARANLVFTGGYSLYEAKKDRHPRVHPFPSSVDRGHFASARKCRDMPDDQTGSAARLLRRD